MFTRTALVVGLLMLAACAIPPSQKTFDNADFGAYPENPEPIIKAYMARALKDPYSVRYHGFSKPKKWWIGGVGRTKVVYGYRVCVTYNAKNSFGAYVGSKTAFFLIRNGVVEKAQLQYGSQTCRRDV